MIPHISSFLLKTLPLRVQSSLFVPRILSSVAHTLKAPIVARGHSVHRSHLNCPPLSNCATPHCLKYPPPHLVITAQIMDHLDTSWCPVCDRQIIPKRYLVPVTPIAPPAPAPPPSSPQLSRKSFVAFLFLQTRPLSLSRNLAQKSDSTTRRTKGGTIRARGGLVHGTGRVKPNGALKRADSTSSTTKNQSATAPLPVAPSGPVKRRVVIDQGPIPLYCSDECRLTDLENISGGLSINYFPDRDSPPLPPVPHNSFAGLARSESGSDTCSSSSVESQSWTSEPSPSSTSSSDHGQYASPSMATIASMYNFPPLPPPPPILSHTDSTSSSSDSEHSNDYQSGIMMAGRRMNAIFRPDPPKRSPYGVNNNLPKEPRKPIPGWTDGSGAWRADVYSFSAPIDPATAGESKRADSKKAYGSFVASPHRSRGVHSTLGESTAASRSSTASLPMRSTDMSTDELSHKFSESFSRRCESRTSLYPSSPSSYPSASTAPRRERSLLKPGAEGKLLVPDVKVKVHSGSSTSLSSTASGRLGSPVSNYPVSSRRSVRSPLSRYASETSAVDVDRDAAFSVPVPRRPVVESELLPNPTVYS